MTKTFSAQQNLDYWKDQAQPIIQRKFEEWAEKGEPVSLFRGLSNIVMTTLIYLLLGDEIGEKYATELAPKVRAYEIAFQTPETKALPRWLSKNGRLMDEVEDLMVELVRGETTRRLENVEKYKNNPDYLQQVLNTVGAEYIDGTIY